MNFRREKFKMNFNSDFFSSSKHRNTDWNQVLFLLNRIFIDFYITNTKSEAKQSKTHFRSKNNKHIFINGTTFTVDGARGLAPASHFSLEHVNDDVLVPRREPLVAGDVLSLAAPSAHDLDGHQTRDPEVRVRPSVHLRYLRPDRARARSAAGSTDPGTRCLHWR